jgi:TatD DNase family protein
MHCIDIHTHQIPAGAGKLFVMNRFPENHLAELPPGGFYSVGLHPWFIGNESAYRKQLSRVEEMIKLDGVIAMGECGLDKACKTDFQLQLDVFLRQCEIAEAVNKPVIIHSVRAWNDIFHLKRKFRPKVPWILHGYNGNEMITRQMLQQDFYYSFGGALLDENSPVRKSLKMIPVEQLFFETDEDLMPVNALYEFTSEWLEVKKDKLAEKIEWNFRQVFVRE